MQNDQELIDVLQRLKAQDINSANHAPLTFDATDKADIKFNYNLYFLVLKSLNEILVNHYKNEQNNGLGNKELLKFTYLGQIHLNRLCFNAIIYPKHIEYCCFELCIFYLAILNLCKSYRFNNLFKALTQLQNRLFLNTAQPSLIISDLASFCSLYQQEVNLYQKQFSLYINYTYPGKITFITEIASDIKSLESFKIIEYYKNPKYDFYQKQLGFKLIEYLHLDSISADYSTQHEMKSLLKFMSTDASEDDKQKELESVIYSYKRSLLKDLAVLMMKNNDSQIKNILDLSHCDYSNLILDLCSFNSVTFVNFDKHTKPPKKFKFCVFKNINFKNREMFENTSFSACIFLHCTFENLTISCGFTSCFFEHCKFENFSNRFADFSDISFLCCNLNNFVLYRVAASRTRYTRSTLTNSAIIFSNLKNGSFYQNKIYSVIFEGTQLNKEISIKENIDINQHNTSQNVFANALFIKNIEEGEFISDEVEEFFQSLGLNQYFNRNLITTTELLGCRLSQILRDDFLNNEKINTRIKFNTLLGWILCATDRLKEYCENFEKNPNTCKLDTFAVFETVADYVRAAMTHLNRFLSLYDLCHLNLMKQLLKNGLFKNFQKYQQVTNFHYALYPQMEKRYLKETLFAIHELHQSINYIDKIFLVIEKKIAENYHLRTRAQPMRETQSLRLT